MVVESRDLWFADDNGLTKELCADPQENEDEQPEINEPCCACDEAKYEVQYIIFFSFEVTLMLGKYENEMVKQFLLN